MALNVTMCICSVPILSVEYEVNGVWWTAARSVNNQWPYHRELGDFSFPLPIRVTSVAGEVITDVVPSATGTSAARHMKKGVCTMQHCTCALLVLQLQCCCCCPNTDYLTVS